MKLGYASVVPCLFDGGVKASMFLFKTVRGVDLSAILVESEHLEVYWGLTRITVLLSNAFGGVTWNLTEVVAMLLLLCLLD